MPFIAHTEEDVAAMLACIGVDNIDALFAEVPKELQQAPYRYLPDGLSEMATLSLAENLANKNNNGTCFAGAGSYDHYIPACVWDIAMRGEFLTSYTPYQAEVSQGNLQLLYEFQTMIAELTGMDVANASMYDGASALAEAILMAVRINKHSQKPRVLIPETIHPFYLKVVKTIVVQQNIEVISLPFTVSTGTIAKEKLEKYSNEDVTALVIPFPNFFGCLEQVDELADWATENKVISIACVNPMALSLFKPPSCWGRAGVDIVCGEGQPLGVPLASGGPYFGFFSTRMEYVRQMPGRLIGRTKDIAGNDGYTLTLQAREQHIRRAKATSNICTNQGLMVTAATIYMSLLGADGLLQVAKNSYANTHFLVDELLKIPEVKLVFSAHFFHEALLSVPNASGLLQFLAENEILGGLEVATLYPNLEDTILVCVTEKRTREEILQYVSLMRTFLGR